MNYDSYYMVGVFLLWERFPVLHLFFSAFRTLCQQLLRLPSLSMRDGSTGKTPSLFFAFFF